MDTIVRIRLCSHPNGLDSLEASASANYLQDLEEAVADAVRARKSMAFFDDAWTAAYPFICSRFLPHDATMPSVFFPPISHDVSPALVATLDALNAEEGFKAFMFIPYDAWDAQRALIAACQHDNTFTFRDDESGRIACLRCGTFSDDAIV